ncbi:MAG: UbiA prenyltransferase family protein [Methanotrichaceae archaeon]
MNIGRYRAYLELLRPPLAPMDLALPCATALLAVYATTGSLPAIFPFLVATIGAYFAITSSYVFNDCCDIDVDLTGMPDRPLPSAQISRNAALIYAIILFGAAAVVAFYLNPESLVMLIVATLVMAIYSKWAKRNTPFSWVLVGLAYGLVPLGVWMAMAPAGWLKTGPGLHPAALILAAMVCITDWGFTNCDASRDVEGDKKKEIPTLPVTYGIPTTSKFVTFTWITGVVLSLTLGMSIRLGILYFVTALVAGIWMIFQSINFVRNPIDVRGNHLFYQGANYRSVLFAVLIADVLLRATVNYPGF